MARIYNDAPFITYAPGKGYMCILSLMQDLEWTIAVPQRAWHVSRGRECLQVCTRAHHRLMLKYLSPRPISTPYSMCGTQVCGHVRVWACV